LRFPDCNHLGAGIAGDHFGRIDLDHCGADSI
jgi:hypothetical protein